MEKCSKIYILFILFVVGFVGGLYSVAPLAYVKSMIADYKKDKKELHLNLANSAYYGLSKTLQKRVEKDIKEINEGKLPPRPGFDWKTVGLTDGTNAEKLSALAEHKDSPLKVLGAMKESDKEAVRKFYNRTKTLTGM